MGATERGVMRRIWQKIEWLIEHIRKVDPEAKPLPWGCWDTKLPPQPTVPLIERLRKTEISSGKYSIESHSFIRLSTWLQCVLYSGEFVLYSTLRRIIHSNAIISLKISPTLCVCGYHILIEPVITPNYNSIHFDCRPSLKPTKVWTLWRPMPLRDRAPLLDVCRKKVNND